MVKSTPLATELRPNRLKDIIGQEHLTDDDKPLAKMVSKKVIRSTILWGPPGIGKTSIVRSLANETDSDFHQLNATKATVSDLRNIITSATKSEKSTIVFVDEVHRWNKSQQDTMLPVVEDGTIVLFGATTEKPKFAVNSTLLSRCLVLELKPLEPQSLVKLIIKIKEHYKSRGRKIEIDKDAARTLIIRCSGDARKLITALETAIEILSDDDHVTINHVNLAIPDKHLVFDARGNDHYDLAHCYQESIQNSDANAAIYWLAKWIESGEDPAYICRRMLITAFEDCAGNPLAGPVAMAACYATERTGLPECAIPMAMATCEMASSNRDKTAYNAIMAALDDVRSNVTVHVPPELRAGTRGYFATINKEYVKLGQSE